MNWPYFTGAPLAANGEAVGSVHHLLRPRWLDPHQIAEVARVGGRHYPILYTQLTVTEQAATECSKMSLASNILFHFFFGSYLRTTNCRTNG
jgi:hypothetical protein